MCVDNRSQEDLVLQAPEVPGTVLHETSPSRLLRKSPIDREAPSQKVGGQRRKGGTMCQDMGWSLPLWRPGLVEGACPAATRPKEAVGRDNSQRPGASLGLPDFHLLAPTCHPSSAPLPATPHRAAAPSTAPAAGAWQHSPWDLCGELRGDPAEDAPRGQRSDCGCRGARPSLPAPQPTLSPATRAPRPRPAPRLPGPSRLCSREETLQAGQQQARLAHPIRLHPAP